MVVISLSAYHGGEAINDPVELVLATSRAEPATFVKEVKLVLTAGRPSKSPWSKEPIEPDRRVGIILEDRVAILSMNDLAAAVQMLSVVGL